MKQKISTLMDGELSADDAELILGKIKVHPEARQEWSTYHLISDALRQPDFVHIDLSADILKRLHDEPTILAPHGKQNSKASYFAMSAVASIMAMAFLAWLSVQIDAGPMHQQARQNPNDLRNASLPLSETVNDYLLAHQEFSPGTDVRGAASYIRTVAVRQTVAGQ